MPGVSGKWWWKSIKAGSFGSVVFLYSLDGIVYEQSGQADNFQKLAEFYNYPQNGHRLILFFFITTESKAHLFGIGLQCLFVFF